MDRLSSKVAARFAGSLKDSPVGKFWEAMSKKVDARPKDVTQGENKIELQWMEGRGRSPYVTITMRQGKPQADVDGTWHSDPAKAAKAFNDWLDLLWEESESKVANRFAAGLDLRRFRRPEQAFEAAKADALSRLEALSRTVANYGNTEKASRDWGYAGSLIEVSKQLENIQRFIGG